VFETKSAKPSGGASPLAWANQIGAWAVEHGLNWEDKETRADVRRWALATGHQCSATGLIPRATMQAYVEAHQDQLSRRAAG
jgi:hypothetical protein